MVRATNILAAVLLAGVALSSEAKFDGGVNHKTSEPCINKSIRLTGLTSPAIVSESIFVHADRVPPGASLDFYIDTRLVDREVGPPYWLGGVKTGAVPKGFQLKETEWGQHQLRAETFIGSRRVCSEAVEIQVIPSNNAVFSREMSPYRHQFLSSESKDDATSHKETPADARETMEPALRQAIIAMYRNWGVDPFIDADSDRSAILRSLTPKNWASPAVSPGRPWSMAFSPDAVFYHRIPQQWPRVALPPGYFQSIQLNTAHGGDGIGFGEVVANENSSELVVRSQWYDVKSTLQEIPFRISSDWSKKLPSTEQGDRHVIFIDPLKMSFVSAYKTAVRQGGTAPVALYAAGPTSFNSLGDSGGSIAANFAELPLLIQPGESTDPLHPIPHAIGGPVRRVWAARVYPASAWDAGVKTSKDTCSGKGQMNTGLIPYGGVIQLDPTLDLNSRKLSLPALRILQAMQTYGYYVMDYGCADLDIYTALDASELEPYGGLWGSDGHPGVQNEVQQVLSTSVLYVVAPLVKKE